MGLGPKTMNVDANTLPDRVCSCGSKFFVVANRLKEIPILYSQSGKPETLIIQAGFVCVSCGNSMPLRPVEKEESKIVVAQ